jgi:hypothetical protein
MTSLDTRIAPAPRGTVYALLAEKHGVDIARQISDLVGELAAYDGVLKENLEKGIFSFFELDTEEVPSLIAALRELSRTSYFAAAFLIEKIGTLIFFGLYKDFLEFLMAIKNYGARNLAYLVGSRDLNADDLDDILQQVNTSYYRLLLHEVKARHAVLDVCAATVMRNAIRVAKVIPEESIPDYLTICCAIKTSHGVDVAANFIDNTDRLVPLWTLPNVTAEIETFKRGGPGYLELALRDPERFPMPSTKADDGESSDLRATKLRIIQTCDWNAIAQQPHLLRDLDFFALVKAWTSFKGFHKRNILAQLEQKDFKTHLRATLGATEGMKEVEQVTGGLWLDYWAFAAKPVDTAFIRNEFRKILSENGALTESAATLYRRYPDVFDRQNADFSSERLGRIVEVLSRYAAKKETRQILAALGGFISGRPEQLRDRLSEETLFIETWARDPWFDYGRSDELFSCTSIGDASSTNAPGFLADINLNNLDVWSHGRRIGRVHLCLVRDVEEQPLVLFDCIDGSERMIERRMRLDLLMTAVLAYAKHLGIRLVAINYDITFNSTPKLFVRYALERFGRERHIYLRRLLTQNVVGGVLPFPSVTFLESFLYKSAGVVRGTVVDVETGLAANGW